MSAHEEALARVTAAELAMADAERAARDAEDALDRARTGRGKRKRAREGAAAVAAYRAARFEHASAVAALAFHEWAAAWRAAEDASAAFERAQARRVPPPSMVAASQAYDDAVVALRRAQDHVRVTSAAAETALVLAGAK